ncbi:MAG: tyrosine-type recombinase/integrase [Candidatus Acidiferrales bacterium]
MREQKGYVFHRYGSWFVRYCDDVKQPDGGYKRKLVCKKLDVEYGGEHRTKASVKESVEKILKPVNSGTLNPDSTQMVCEFVEKIYLPEYVKKNLRAATVKQYTDVWENHLKPRMGKLTLRDFRTVHGEQMLAKIAEQAKLGRSSLRHCKAFLSGAFKQAKRLGILDGINPIMDVSIPRVPEAAEDTYAYSLSEIKAMLAMLEEPARTIVLTAAFTGLRKSELLGLRWQDFSGKELSVNRSRWNGIESEPKTRRSRSPIPVVKQLGDALNAHRLRMGILAQPDLPIFQAGNGQPLNLDNLARRVIAPVSSWHGWHAFRRGLATNLHALGVDDKTIQAILRHSNIGLTMNVYVKSVSESQVSAMDSLSEKLGTCTVLATSEGRSVN